MWFLGREQQLPSPLTRGSGECCELPQRGWGLSAPTAQRFSTIFSTRDGLSILILFGLEVCPLTKSDLKSLDFPVNRFFMKLIKTSNIQMVKDCQVYFGFDLLSVIIDRQSKKFLSVNVSFLVKSVSSWCYHVYIVLPFLVK